MPVPLAPVSDSPARWNGSKIASRSRAGTPGPRSATLTTTRPPASRVATVTSPPAAA